MELDYVFLDDGNISLHDDRWYTKPWGVNGGGVGARSTKTLVQYSIDSRNPPRKLLQSKEDFIQVIFTLSLFFRAALNSTGMCG